MCYVSFGGKAQPIPEAQITSIKALVSQTEEEVTLTYKNIKKGQKAEVVYGSLKGVAGEIVEVQGQSRILIRLETMNCSIYANIDKEEIKLIKPEKVKTRRKSKVAVP